MEQDNNKRRTGQNVAFYTALAVCLIAVGVGTWELLQPERSGNGASAVSSAVALPGGASGDGSAASDGVTLPDVVTLPDGDAALPDGVTASPDGGAEIPTSGAAEIAESASGDASGGAAESVNGSGAASVPKDDKSSDAKSGAKSEKSDAKSKDSGAKSSKDSSAKSSKESGAKGDSSASSAKNSKSDAKADKSKLSGEAVRPVEGETVTGFSMDKLLYNETMRDWRNHDGVDIAADAGTAVVSARAGTVESVTADPIMGCTVTVRHADKWESVYASLSDMTEVEAGDDVIAGQVIGFVGETAASESALGPHLHFSVLNDGVPVDPETFLV